MTMTINGSGTITGITAGGLPDATITSAELASNAVTTAKITDANVTQAKLETLVVPLGVGQTWQNVTASRASGTTYTNTTGRPIMVSIVKVNNGSSTVTVGGVTVSGGFASSNDWPMCFVVPSGTTYVATVSGIGLWSELR